MGRPCGSKARAARLAPCGPPRARSLLAGRGRRRAAHRRRALRARPTRRGDRAHRDYGHSAAAMAAAESSNPSGVTSSTTAAASPAAVVLEVTVSRMGRRCGSTSRTARPAPCGPQRLLAPRLVVFGAALRFTASTTALVGRIRVRCAARAVQRGLNPSRGHLRWLMTRGGRNRRFQKIPSGMYLNGRGSLSCRRGSRVRGCGRRPR